MLRPIRRAAARPAGSRHCRIGTWGGGLGTFWQQGNQIGVIWDVMPKWGEVTPPMQSYYHVLKNEDVARQYFNLMEESMRVMRPDLGKKEEG